jgi:hypothetical protein
LLPTDGERLGVDNLGKHFRDFFGTVEFLEIFSSQ